MQIPLFQGLCLLPDGETFVTFSYNRTSKKYRKREMRLEQVCDLLASFYTVGFGGKRGIGYLIKADRLLIRTDGEKTRAFLKAYGLKMKGWKKKAPNTKMQRITGMCTGNNQAASDNHAERLT